MADPRTQAIRVRNIGSGQCSLCGKNTAKRKGKQPAPIWLLLDFKKTLFRRSFDPAKDEGWELGRIRTANAICMACAKRIVSRLDAVIEQIESGYK